jgi:hypothetical protein
MRSTMHLSNRSMLMPGLCVLVGSLFTSGVAMNSAFAAPPRIPIPPTVGTRSCRASRGLLS